MSPTDDFLGMRPGSRRRRAVQWIAVALAAVAVIVLVGRFVNGGEATRYTTAAVAREDLQAALTGTGALLSTGQRELTAEVDGTVTFVLVRDGQRVTKGQVLAQIDPSALAADVGAAQSLIGAREAAANVANAADRQAREQLKRFNEVRERSNNLAPSDREMVLARDAARDAAAAARDAGVELDAARAALADRQARLALAQIAAPEDGLIVRRRVAPGAAVVAHDTPLFDIADAPVRLQMQMLVERDAAQALRPGAAAQITMARQTYPASVALVRPARSAGETQVIVLLDIPNPGGALRPGMMAEAKIPLAAHKDALVVPAKALEFARASDTTAGAPTEGQAVYVLSEQGAPRRVPVTIDGGGDGKVAVVSDTLPVGSPVITGLRR